MSQFDLKQELNLLIKQKEDYEIEADAIYQELTSIGPNQEPPAGIKDSLVDKEGFPRGDIDIVNVKNKRRRLAEINTDHKEIMKLIESKMSELHKTINYEYKSPLSSLNARNDLSSHSTIGIINPIGTFDEVIENSPASIAGIMNGDQLLKYGNIQLKGTDGIVSNADITNCMNDIAKYTGNHVNQEITLIIKTSSIEATSNLNTSSIETTTPLSDSNNNTNRDKGMKTITIIPKQWGGKGLLGCHLTPTIIPK